MNDATPEEWRPVHGWEESYEASSLGRVRSVERLVTPRTGGSYVLPSRILIPKTHQYHYRVTLCRPGLQSSRLVHQLVCEAFHGPKPFPGAVVRHLDDNPHDNRPVNLSWGTYSQNQLDIIANGNNFWVNKTHCKRGHEFNVDNTYIRTFRTGRQARVCRACKRGHELSKRQRRAA